MKIRIILITLSLSLLFCGRAFAVGSWTAQDSTTKRSLFSIFFHDEQHGWALSMDTLLRTTNGGQNWTASPTVFSSDIPHSMDIWFTGTDTGYMIKNNKIYYTINSGLNWSIQDTGYKYSALRKVFFINHQKGWAVGGTHIYTIPIYPGDTSFMTRQIMKTVDGINWTTVLFNSSNNPNMSPLNSIAFMDSNNGVAVGDYGNVIVTTDGGSSWKDGNGGTTQGLYKVAVVGPGKYYAVGYNGTIISSVDSGKTWIQYPSGTGAWLNDVKFVDSLNGWIVGDSGKIFYTSDGGNNWLPQSAGTNADINSIAALALDKAWAVAGNWPGSHVDNGKIYYYSESVGVSINNPVITEPSNFSVSNFPNPFINKTVISYSLPCKGKTSLIIYNIAGQLVRTLVNEEKMTGKYHTVWNGQDNNNRKAAQGVYFCKLESGNVKIVNKMILAK